MKNKISSGEGKSITTKSDEGVVITADSKAKPETTVNVTVKANEGYKVTGATYSYYEPGSATKTTKNLEKVKDGVSGSTGYTFKMPNADVVIEATYTKKNTNDAPYEDDISDLFNDDREDGPENLGPGALFNEGTNGAGEADTTTPNGQYTITSYTQKDNNKDIGSVFSENGKANENDTVVIKVNPAADYELKEGTLKYTYTADGAEKTETIEKTNGAYSFKMPAADVKLSAEFQKKDGSGSSTETKTSNDMYGAIAFTFAGNWNLVYVDTTGVLFANNGLSLDAKANSKVLTLADASKVNGEATEASKSDTEKKEEKKNEQSGNTPGGDNESGNTPGGDSEGGNQGAAPNPTEGGNTPGGNDNNDNDDNNNNNEDAPPVITPGENSGSEGSDDNSGSDDTGNNSGQAPAADQSGSDAPAADQGGNGNTGAEEENNEAPAPLMGDANGGSENSESGNEAPAPNPTEGGNSGSGNSEGGNTPGGNSEGGNTPGGNNEGGNNQGGNTEEKKSGKLNLGAAVSLGVTKVINKAYIKSGQIYANGLEIKATTGSAGTPMTSVVKAFAGNAKAATAIGGSVAVQVVTDKTSAFIEKGATVNLQTDSPLTVKAEGFDKVITVADGASAGNGENLGIGAGLALAVNGQDVYSGIEDGTAIKSYKKLVEADASKGVTVTDIENAVAKKIEVTNPALSAVDVTAEHKGDERLYATSGAGGKTGIAGTLVGVYSGISTKAYIGEAKETNELLTASGDINVKANNKETREMAADATAGGSGTGIGVNLLITLENDSSRAYTKRSLKAQNINVKSNSQVKTKSRSRSSAKGAKADKAKSSASDGDGSDGASDKQADKTAAGLSNLAGNGTSNVNSGTGNSLNANRQKAKTSEGSVEIAAAFAVNVQKNVSEAKILGSYKVTTINDLNVIAEGKMDIDVLASGAATNSTTGIGVAAAASGATYENIASVEAADVSAKNLTVKAGFASAAEDATKTDLLNTMKTEAIAGAGAKNVGIAGAVAIGVVNGTDRAIVTKDNKLLTAAEKLVIEAIGGHKEETTASAKATNEGSADKNKETTGSSETKKESGNIGIGATFVLDVVNTETEAEVDSETATGASVLINAVDNDFRETTSASGTDPVTVKKEGEGQNINGTAVDATVALGIVDNVVNAKVGENSTVIAKGEAKVDSGKVTDRKLDDNAEIADGDIFVKATTNSKADTKASGFATADNSAIGAAVALNIASSEANAKMNGRLFANGNVLVKAYSYDEDDSLALATAIGADMQRFLTKFQSGESDKKEENSGNNNSGNNNSGNNNSGNSQKPKPSNQNNETATNINNALNKNKKAEGENADNSKSLSQNALGTQDAKAEGTENSTVQNSQTKANQEASNNSSNVPAGGTNNNSAKGTKIRVAAAIALNITSHTANTVVTGLISESNQNTVIEAINHSNGTTKGSAATATMAGGGENSYNVSLAVGLSVNNNKTNVKLGNDDEAAHVESSGNIIVKAENTQNLDGDYKKYLNIQSVAGTSAGGSKFAMAGALSVLYSATDTEVSVGANSDIMAKTGGNVSIFSTDKSKYAARAAGVEAGRSANVGVGATFINMYVDDTVRTLIGDKVTIKGNDVAIYAEKAKVSSDDYESTFEFSHYIKFTKDKERDTSSLIHINYNSKSSEKKEGETTQSDSQKNADNKTIEVYKNLNDVENILAKIDDLNFLSSANYYLEAISGAIATGGENDTLAAAGSIALLFENVTVETILGKEVMIEAANNARIEAKSDVIARELVGGVGFDGSATATIGATVAVISTDNTIRTVVGDSDVITAGGTYKQTSSENNDSLMVTFAGSHADKVSVAGTIAIGVTDDDIYAGVSDKAQITSEGENEIKAHLKNDILEIVATLAESEKVAVGGVINYQGSTSKTAAEAGTSAVIVSRGDSVKLTAETEEDFISILAAASAATGTAQVAAVLNVLTSDSKTYANTGASTFEAAKDVIIKANTDSDIVTVAVTAGYGKTVAVDGILSVNVLRRKVAALIGENSEIIAHQNAQILSSLDENVVMVLVSAAGSQKAGISGLIPIIVTKNIVRTVIGNVDVDDALTNTEDIKNGTDENNVTRITADGSIYADSRIDSDTVFVQLSAAFGKDAGVGATISTVVQQSIVDTIVNNWAALKAMATLSAITVSKPGKDAEGKDRTDAKTGIILYASAKADVTMVSLSGAGGKTAAIGGTINTLIVNNTVRAHVRDHSTLLSGVNLDEWGADDSYAVEKIEGAKEASDIDVEADSYADVVDVVGGLSGSQTAAVGATIAYLGLNTKVETLTNASYMLAGGQIDVKALSNDEVFLFTVAGSGAQTAAVAGNAAVVNVDNFTKAEARQVLRADIAVNIVASAKEDLTNVGLSASGAGTAAIAATGVVINLDYETYARIYDAADVRSNEVKLTATTISKLNGFAIGAEGAGTAAVGGSLEVIVVSGSTKAVVGAFAKIRGVNTTAEEDDRAGEVVILAYEEVDALAVVATVGGAGTAAIELSVLVASVNSTVSAVVENHVKILSKENVSVKSDARRNFEGFIFSIAGSGTASISANIAVVSVGSKLNKDAYDAIYQKDGDSSGVDPVATTGYVESFAEFKPASANAKKSKTGKLSAVMSSDDESVMKITGGNDLEGNYGNYGQNSTTASDGQSVNAEPTDEQAGKASEIINKSTTQNAENLKNVVSAIIGAATIDASKNINVTAMEIQSSLLISGAIAGGGVAGIGASISVELLHSNVLADVTEYASLTAGDTVNVIAYSGTVIPENDNGKSFEYQDANFNDTMNSAKVMDELVAQGAAESGYKAKELGIYVIGVVVGGGGTAGVSVSIAYVGVSTDVRALMQGTINSAKTVNVHAKYNYDSLHNILIGAAGGYYGGVSATVALTFFDGNAEAGITKTAKVNNVTNMVYVHADGLAGVSPVGVSGSFGFGAAAASITVSANRSTVQAYVGMGALINAPSAALVVTSDVTSNANPTIVTVSIGVVGVNINVMVSLNEAKNLAYIGRTPKVDNADIEAVEGANGSGINTITAKSVDVKADAKATSTLDSYSFSASGIGLNGAVTVANSKVINTAYVADTNITTGDLTIKAILNNDLHSYSLGAKIQGISGGVQVAVGRIKSINLAHLDTTNVKVNAENVNVNAGDADVEDKKDDKNGASGSDGKKADMGRKLTKKRLKQDASVHLSMSRSRLHSTSVDLNLVSTLRMRRMILRTQQRSSVRRQRQRSRPLRQPTMSMYSQVRTLLSRQLRRRVSRSVEAAFP